MDEDYVIVSLDGNKITCSDTSDKDEFDYVIVSLDGNKITCSDTSGSSTAVTDGSQKSTKTLLLDDIKKINERLVHVLVELDSDEDAAGGREGITVKCSFIPVGLNGPLKLLVDTMLPFPPLLLLIPVDYPESSPVILNDWTMYKRFKRDIEELVEPISLEEMARGWRFYIEEVINEYAQKSGVGTFSLK